MEHKEKQPLLKSASEKYNEKQDVENNRGLSVLFATLCVIDLFGVFPIVTMPRSIIDCGWLGIPLVIGVFILQVYTATLLGRCWIMAERINPAIKLKSRRPYAAIAEMTYGQIPGKLVTILLDLTVFAGGVPNLLVASQNMQLLGEKAVSLHWNISYCYWMPLIGLALCPFMWLGSPKDMKLLVVSSSLMVIFVSLLTWILIIGDDIPTPNVPVPRPSWESIAIAYGIIAFQFDVHPMILTVQVDMAERKKLGRAIIAGFSITGCLFMITTILAAVWYGGDLEYNLIGRLPSSKLLDVNVLFATLQVCLSTVVGCTTLFQDLEDRLGIQREFNLWRCALRTGLVILSVGLSEIVPRFDLIMGLVGGSMMGPLMFIMPPLFYARLRAMEPQPEFEPIISDTNKVTEMSFSSSECDVNKTKKSYFYVNPEYRREETKRHGNNRKSYENLGNYGHESKLKTSFFGGLNTKVQRNLKQLLCLDDYPKIGPMIVWEKMKTIMIVSAGLLATFLSTYYSLLETIKYARFTPPCVINITAATLAIE